MLPLTRLLACLPARLHVEFTDDPRSRPLQWRFRLEEASKMLAFRILGSVCDTAAGSQAPDFAVQLSASATWTVDESMFIADVVIDSNQTASLVSALCCVEFDGAAVGDTFVVKIGTGTVALRSACPDQIPFAAATAAARLRKQGFERTRKEPLGSGFFSSVFEAKCVAATGPCPVGGLVAIKELFRPFDPESMNEASVQLTSNSFPHCVKCFNLFIDSVSGRLCLVFERCLGGNLESFLRNCSRPIDEALLTSWFVQMLEALVAMSAVGVTHDDIALRNVLLLTAHDTSALRLSDFGIARFAGRAGSSAKQDYGSAAPECAAGELSSSASDMWSLGCLMLQLASRDPKRLSAALREPGSESKTDDKPQSLQHRLYQDVASACQEAGYSDEFRAIVCSLLVLDPKQRASAGGVLTRLRPTGLGCSCFVPCMPAF